MNTLLYVIIGMLIMQLITVLTLVITKENTETTSFVGCCVWWLLISNIVKVLRPLRLVWLKHHYYCVTIENNKSVYERRKGLQIRKKALKNYHTIPQATEYWLQIVEVSAENWQFFRSPRQIKKEDRVWIKKHLMKTK